MEYFEDWEVDSLRVCFDLETTGLSVDADQIVQLAAVSQQDSFQSFVKASRPINPVASKITGISDETIKDAPVFRVVHLQFKAWIRNLRAKSFRIVAHNGFRFDFPLWFTELKRAGFDVATEMKECRIEWFNDTFPIAQLVSVPPFKLGILHERYVGTALTEAHEAKADCTGLQNIIESTAFQFQTHENRSNCCWSVNGLITVLNNKQKERAQRKTYQPKPKPQPSTETTKQKRKLDNYSYRPNQANKRKKET